MTTSVNIHLAVTQRLDETTETSRYEYEGSGTSKAGGWYVSYKEQLEDDMTVQTTLKISDAEITLLRQGNVQMKQQFREGERSESYYTSPYGRLLMEIRTNRLNIERKNNRPERLTISYQMWMNGEETGEHTLELTFNWQD